MNIKWLARSVVMLLLLKWSHFLKTLFVKYIYFLLLHDLDFKKSRRRETEAKSSEKREHHFFAINDDIDGPLLPCFFKKYILIKTLRVKYKL